MNEENSSMDDNKSGGEMNEAAASTDNARKVDIGTTIKYLAEIKLGFILTISWAIISLIAWATWELKVKPFATKFVRDTMLETKTDIEMNLNKIHKEISELKTLAEEHQNQISKTIDSWQAFEFYRYYPTILDANDKLIPDTSRHAFLKTTHSIIAYPSENLRLYFFADRYDAGGKRRIETKPLKKLRLGQKEIEVGHQGSIGKGVGLNIPIYCGIISSIKNEFRIGSIGRDEPRPIRLELVLDNEDENVEFTYKLYVLSTKRERDEENEC